jgi:hypothetical protein
MALAESHHKFGGCTNREGFDFVATFVQVSARILRFPQACCCCGGAPDTHIDASSTRVTGKRVVRTQSKSWSFPICRRCLEHVSLSDEAGKLHQAAQNHKSIGIACIIAGIMLMACLIGIPILIYGIVAVSRLAPNAVRRAKELEDEARKFLSNHWARHNGVVIYHGWNGSIHYFEFQSDSYAQAFIAANGNKALGSYLG